MSPQHPPPHYIVRHVTMFEGGRQSSNAKHVGVTRPACACSRAQHAAHVFSSCVGGHGWGKKRTQGGTPRMVGELGQEHCWYNWGWERNTTGRKGKGQGAGRKGTEHTCPVREVVWNERGYRKPEEEKAKRQEVVGHRVPHRHAGTNTKHPVSHMVNICNRCQQKVSRQSLKDTTHKTPKLPSSLPG